MSLLPSRMYSYLLPTSSCENSTILHRPVLSNAIRHYLIIPVGNSVSHSFVHSFIHSFIQHKFIEGLLCVKHCGGPCSPLKKYKFFYLDHLHNTCFMSNHVIAIYAWVLLQSSKCLEG